jgi:predicted RNA methylase
MVFADLFQDILYSYETFGKLLPRQRRILSRVVNGRVVHDLGAGNCLLSKKLLNMGAAKVHAVD